MRFNASNKQPLGTIILMLLAGLACFACILLTFKSLHVGTPWFDEGAYMLPTYKFLLGQLPFIDEYSFLQLPAIFLHPIFKLYHILKHHSIDGIFLFERRLYTCMAIGGAVTLACILKKFLPLYAVLLIAINLISFAPFGLHSPSYDNLVMLFLSLSTFLLFHSVNNIEKKVTYPLIGSGFFLAFAITIYPPLSVSLLFISLFYKKLQWCRFKYYFFGLVLGSLWLTIPLLHELPHFIFAMKWSAASHQAGGYFFLTKAITWYLDVFFHLKYPIASLLLLLFSRRYFKRIWLWELLAMICLLSSTAFIIFTLTAPFGNGMGYTIAFFLLAPVFYLYTHPSKLSQQLLKIVWGMSLISWPIVAYSSLSVGLSTVIVLFPGTLAGITLMTLIFTEIKHFPIKCVPSLLIFLTLLTITYGYQSANLMYSYGEISTANANYSVDHGAFASLSSIKETVDFMQHVEEKLKPYSGKKKTLYVSCVTCYMTYFLGDFIPYTPDTTGLAQITFNYFNQAHDYPDLIVKIKPPPTKSIDLSPSKEEKKTYNKKYFLVSSDDMMDLYVKK